MPAEGGGSGNWARFGTVGFYTLEAVPFRLCTGRRTYMSRKSDSRVAENAA